MTKRTPKPKVAIGFLTGGKWSNIFGLSLLKLMLYETGRTGLPPYLLAELCSSGNIVAGRNRVHSAVLDTPAEWLLWIDDDMGFAPDTLERLLKSADPKERPIMGALCFATKRQQPDPVIHAERYLSCPTIYRWVERDDEVGFAVVKNYPRDQVTESAATGTALVLVHRSVIEAVKDKYGATWFDPAKHPLAKGGEFSEDFSFFIRAAACGFKVHVDTSVKTAHDKGILHLTEETWDAQQAMLAPVTADEAA